MKVQRQNSQGPINPFQKKSKYPKKTSNPISTTNQTDIKCEKLKKGLQTLKEDLSKECDDILGKIDQILNTELTSFDKIKDDNDSLEEVTF